MAVFTPVSAEELALLLARYDAGTLVSAKGIAEGVENSNFLVDTTTGRYILTLYEGRVDVADLPFFLTLLDHLADRGLPVPRAIRDRAGVQVQTVAGRPACLIEYLTGVSVTHPTAAQTRSAGAALGSLHAGLRDFAPRRPNALGITGWNALADRCGPDLDRVAPGLAARVADERAYLDAHWPHDLPVSVIHADLFPDNVLMLGDAVTGIIDFYFACADIRVLDVAITHASWCFDADGSTFHPDRAAALLAGYAETFGLSDAERAALPVLARGASLRFALTRAWDWLNTPADALVTRKDPAAFVRRMDAYRDRPMKELFPL
ncbi:homoserine kinase [Sphingomonas prati]|uniref:Homoserine kinase n=1 Tax=Sphingomonas prati TaxID=1843237 RepID=A0A7W9BTF1_9SPHN|nr:homoserine kinase [Sphingomonas prati]MBB5729278.1 homoserine kinase type II [Sphingomonas prati]GGE78677.1 homoserine kinase [Sphingomonas prati]